MTLESNGTVVRLSARDWIAIVGIAITVMGGVLTAFIHHDRMLMQVVTQQQNINDRLNKIEHRLDDGHR
jgi:uncharacterized membrane-anchored protein YhcB (DUF1043 family)